VGTLTCIAKSLSVSEEQGQSPEQRSPELGWVKAPREVALRLDVDDDAGSCAPAAVRRQWRAGRVLPQLLPTGCSGGDAAGGAGADRDRAVEVQDTVAAADKHRFRYEVRMR
jgi:hypothetical protein